MQRMHDFINCKYLNKVKTDISKINYPKTTDIIERVDILKNSFSELSSEYRFKVLETNNLLINPVSVYLWSLQEMKKGTLVTNRIFCSYIPIDEVLNKILECDNVLNSIMAYHSKLLDDNNNICNNIETDFWKNEIKEYGNSIVFSLFLFKYAFETGNPLGSFSGTHKLNGFFKIVRHRYKIIASHNQNEI